MMKASSESQKITALTKEFPAAVNEIDKQLKESPLDAELWFKRGQLLGNERLMRDAIDSFSRAIAIDPMCGIYYRWRGHRHINVAEIPEACADLTIMTQAFGLANYYLINGQREKYDETIDFIVENGTKAWNCFGYSSASYIQRTRK